MEIFGLALLAIIVIVLTLGFDFVNGFNDSANSISTVVATKVLTPFQAVSLAAIFNFLGIFIGRNIAKTVGTGIIDKDLLWDHLLLILFCAVVAAIIWDLITWWFAIPTSSSHALVGGLIGAGVAVAGLDAIVWTGFWSSGITKTILFIVVSPMVGLAAAFLLTVIVTNSAKKKTRHQVNKWFRKLQIVSSMTLALTHGTNDAQKGMGIIALIILIDAGDPSKAFDVPIWAMLACQTAISLGTFFGGWRIVKTMASKITKLDPSQGFCAETGAAVMLFTTARLGIPVSTTHTISGAIIGVGATRRLSAVRWGVGRRIVIAWILTIPAAASVSGLLFLGLHALGY
jgi:inorganic phosphate transporter, PiT family